MPRIWRISSADGSAVARPEAGAPGGIGAAAARGGGVSPAPDAGFVLMEILPALIILGLLVAMAFPALPRGTGSARLLALAVESAALVRGARTEAIASGRDVVAVVDIRRRMLVQGGTSVVMPADIDLSILSSDTCPKEADRIAILFRPDGTSCGGVVRFAKGPRGFRLRVNWATGNVAIVDGA